MKTKIRLILSLLLITIAFAMPLLACTPDDAITEDIYTTGNFYSWNGTAWNPLGTGGVTVEVDPIFIGSPAFGITAGNIVTWNAHPPLTTGTHGVTGTIVGTSDAQALTNKSILFNNNIPLQWKTAGGVPQDTISLIGSNHLMITNPSGSIQLRGGAINLNTGIDEEIYLWGSGTGTGRELVLYCKNSDAINTTRDSPTINMATSYWDGGAGVGWDGDIVHDMITAGATPKSQFRFSINNVNILRMENNNGVASTLADGTLYSENITPKTTGTYSIGTPTNNYTAGYFHELFVDSATLYIGGVPITAENLTGGGHTHANMSILDTIEEAFTTSLKTSYDWLVANITESWKTSVDNHINSAHAPSDAQKNSDITKEEIEAKLIGEISSHTHAGGSGESETVVVLTADRVNSSVNLANVTDLTFNADANSTYIIEGFIVWGSSATTVGIKLSATASNSPTITAGHFITDAANGTPDSSSYNANDVVVTTSASMFTTNNMGKLDAVLKTGASTSTWQLRFAAETTGSITIRSGSVIRYRKVQ